MAQTDHVIDQLCLHCGICCNGVLFADVKVGARAEQEAVLTGGIPLRRRVGKPAAFPQPCAALGTDCRCGIYPIRPGRCREFECALLKKVAAGEMEVAAALRNIRQALRLSERVKALLRELGDEVEGRALSLRFQRMQRRIHGMALDENTAGLYGDLTLAVHELNMNLRRHFYPRAGD